MKLRKTAALLLAACMAGAALTACSAAPLTPEEVAAPYYPDDNKAESVVVGGVKYNVYQEHAELVGFAQQFIHATLEIPSTVEDRPVTAIRRGSYLPDFITSVTIPDTVRIIDANAFSDCSELAEITFPDSLTYIGEDAFEGTPWLLSQRSFDDDRLILAGCILIDGTEASGAVSIPNTVVSISPGAFRGNERITGVTIPFSVALIGEEAFIGCTSLKTIFLPSSVMQIGSGAFRNTALETVSLPGGLTELGDSAFEDCAALTRIDIPGSLTAIGENAFCGCSSLTSIEIPAGVESIGANAFASCDALTSVFIFGKECEIADTSTTLGSSGSCVVYAPGGSVASDYAAKYNYEFRKI